METIKEQMNLEPENEAVVIVNNENRRHNPGLKALLSMRNCHISLEKEYVELLGIEAELDAVNKAGMLQITTHCTNEMQASWKEQADLGYEAAAGINKSLEAEKEKIGKKEVTNFNELWKSLASDVKKLRNSAATSRSLGIDMLPETAHAKWENEFVHVQSPLTAVLVAHIESCMVLLQMIEKYTPEELNTISKIVVDKIPLDFTYQEAVFYEKDYFKALVDFKQEFAEEKNLWDMFLDILAGGTHQQPSERVMMERWIEGEKGELV